MSNLDFSKTIRSMKNKILNNPLIIVILLIIISSIPYLILSTNSYFTIHDNLDGEFVYYHILKINNLLFGFNGNTIIPNVMNGLPRAFYHSEFSFIRLLFFLLPSFWAYVINLILVRLIGFIGMYLFLKDYVFNKQNTFLIIILSLMFAFLPYYPLYGVSVSGQAILLWAFLNLYNDKHKLYSYLIIVSFPFYSHFALIAPFILVGISILGIHLYGKDLFKSEFFLAIIVLTFTYIVANYITIHNFIFPKYISDRTEWITTMPSIKKSITDFISIIKSNQYHSATFNALPIYILALLSIYKSKTNKKLIIIILTYVISIALFYSIYPFIKFYIGNKIHIIITFQFNRFIFLIPFLWFAILALSSKSLKNKISKIILYSLIFIQFGFIIKSNKELVFNYAKLIIGNKIGKINNIPTYKTFFSTKLFSKIDSIIGLPKKDYRVVSLGIHPSIAQYNGFYTLDSYQNNYPLSYKHSFQKIIQPELNRNKQIRDYFINWGSRCYLFSSELRDKCYLNCTKNNVDTINLFINIKALKELGGKYIFSSVIIKNYKELNLNYITSISDHNSLWKINLYKVK